MKIAEKKEDKSVEMQIRFRVSQKRADDVPVESDLDFNGAKSDVWLFVNGKSLLC